MKTARIFVHGQFAGILTEVESEKVYSFQYSPDYVGPGVSLTMPVTHTPYEFTHFPPFFEGLLPEGLQLEGLLKIHKIDARDYFTQLVHVGRDLVGAVTVEEPL